MSAAANHAPGPERRAMLAKLHLARKQIGMREEDYRAALLRVTGRRSAAECSDAQLDLALTEMKRLGFRPAKPKGARPAPASPQQRKILAVWRDLAPYVSDPSESALRVFVRRQTAAAGHPVDAVQFLDGDLGNRVLEGLKAWLAREERKAEAARRCAATGREPGTAEHDA